MIEPSASPRAMIEYIAKAIVEAKGEVFVDEYEGGVETGQALRAGDYRVAGLVKQRATHGGTGRKRRLDYPGGGRQNAGAPRRSSRRIAHRCSGSLPARYAAVGALEGRRTPRGYGRGSLAT